MEIQKLFVTLALEAKEYAQGLNDAASQAASIGRRIGASIQDAGRVMTTALAAGALAAGAALGSVAMEGLRFNNSMEQVSAQLMAFMKDGEKVEETLAMIQERAANTPFAFEDMAKAVTGLVPAATQANVPLEELIATAEILAASNPAQGLEGAAFALREAVSGDFASIIERFNLPRAYINQLREEGVPALEAVQMAMAQLGLDTDLVTNLANTFEGRWSTVKDTFTGFAAQLTKPIFDLVSASMGRFLEKLDALKPLIETSIALLSGVVSSFVANLQEGMSPLDAFIEAIWEIAPQGVLDALVNLRDNIIPALGEAFNNYIQPIVDWVSENVQLSDVLTAVGIAIMTFVVPALISMLLAAAPIVLAIVALIAIVALLRTAWEENWGGIQEKTAAAIEFVKTTIANGLAAIQAWWAENGDAIIAKALEIWTIVSGHISTGIENAKRIISEGIAIIKGWWDENGESITAKALEIWTAVKDHINTGIENAKEIISTALATILAWWEENGEKVTATVEAIWDGIKNAYKTASAFVLGIIASALAVIGGDWETAGEAWNTVVEDAWEKLKTAFTNGLDIIGNAVGDAWPRIKQAFSDGIETIKDLFTSVDWGAVGTAIIQGVANGISAAVGLIQDAAAAAAQTALDAAKGLLGIESPSKVAAAQIGIPFSQGMGEGVMDGLSYVQSALDIAMTDLFSGAEARMASQQSYAMAGGSPMANGGGGGNTYSANTTVNVAAGDDPLRALRAARLLDALGA